MTSVDYIITAKHYAEREGCGSVRERILRMREKIHKSKNIALQVVGLDAPSGQAVEARIWQGQWVADCECGGCEFVDASEPIFYCFSCANRENKNRVRPVTFPVERMEIEQLVLARPVDDRKGLTDLERAGLAKAAVIVDVDGVEMPLARSWNPSESIDELIRQNSVLDGIALEDGKVVVVRMTPPVLRTSPQISAVAEYLEGEIGKEVSNVI